MDYKYEINDCVIASLFGTKYPGVISERHKRELGGYLHETYLINTGVIGSFWFGNNQMEIATPACF